MKPEVEVGTTAAVGEERYCAGPALRVRVGAQHDLVMRPAAPGGRVVSRNLAAALPLLNTFATLPQHRDRIVSAFRSRGVDPAEIDRELLALAAQGVLVPVSRLLGVARTAASATRPAARIGWIAIPTRERPGLLSRALASYLENCERFGRSPKFLVVDGAPEGGAAAVTRRAVAGVAAERGRSVFYAGAEQKRSYAARLAGRTGVRGSLVEFALMGDAAGFAAGANRNLALLVTSGDLLYFADDDTTAEGRLPHGVTSHLALTSGYEPRTRDFFPDRASASLALVPEPRSLLDEHERLVGRRVLDLIGEQSEPPDVGPLSPDYVEALLRDESSVKVSVSGLYGHSGVSWPTRLLSMDGESRERLVRSEDVYGWACRTGEVVKFVTRPTLVHMGCCDAGLSAFDNRDLDVPFLPVLKGEDSLFAYLLQVVHAHSVIGFIPFAVQHDPVGDRSYPDGSVTAYRGEPLSYVLVSTLAQLAGGLVSTDPADRAARLGRGLRDFAALPVEGFRSHLQGTLATRAGDRIMRLEALLAGAGSMPTFWARDAEAQLASFRSFVQRGDAVPFDIQEGRTVDEALACARRLFALYGELLEAWPCLARAAREEDPHDFLMRID